MGETLSYMAFPREHWTRIRTNNVLERIMREIRRRTRVVGNFPDGQAALMLVAARLRHIAGTRWGTRRYLDMERLAADRAGSCRDGSDLGGPMSCNDFAAPHPQRLGEGALCAGRPPCYAGDYPKTMCAS